MTLRGKIVSLINASNTATGSTDTDLTSAVSRLCSGYGGSIPSNTYVGTTVMPSSRLGTKTVEVGFSPKIVGVWVYDDVNNLNTFSVMWCIDGTTPSAIYFQDQGYHRNYVADGTADNAKGHVIGVTSNGFILMTCESYFIEKTAKIIALGE